MLRRFLSLFLSSELVKDILSGSIVVRFFIHIIKQQRKKDIELARVYNKNLSQYNVHLYTGVHYVENDF